jgi:hypothetical protein
VSRALHDLLMINIHSLVTSGESEYWANAFGPIICVQPVGVYSLTKELHRARFPVEDQHAQPLTVFRHLLSPE